MLRNAWKYWHYFFAHLGLIVSDQCCMA